LTTGGKDSSHEEVTFLSLERISFLSYRERIRGFHELLTENTSFLFMLLGWSFIAVNFLIESAQECMFLRQDAAVVKWHRSVLHKDS
jgi:hypothetical protein